ncbi:MAG: succinyl-diaminopimelate desuccinylase [Arenicellales bacterium]|nr:succinyl-diaminopimelate desuccinylase [Arenicellales bacterium]
MQDITLELTKELVARPSITPRDEGCQEIVAETLSGVGFAAESMCFGDVDNLWLRRNTVAPLLVFAGHTDVVPTGPLDKWRFDPFVPTEHDGYLYGRGAADMKASIAAFVTAVTRFIEACPEHRGSIALLLTSDEEGPAVDGTKKVVDKLSSRGEGIDYCIVGEPSSELELGDTIKIGRRGSLLGRLVIHGIRGHVAYPHQADNPIHRCLPILNQLAGTAWDEGSDEFPPTTFQVTDITTVDSAENVVPGEVCINFNFRHSTVSTADVLMARVEEVLNEHNVRFELEWKVSGSPFVTKNGQLIDIVSRAIAEEIGINTVPSTSGGTSDGRFIAPTGAQVVELGPVNKTIHKTNECIALEAPGQLSNIYYRILVGLLT